MSLYKRRSRCDIQSPIHEQKLEQTAEPTAALRLALYLETIDIQKVTADYRQHLNRLGDQVLAQERRNTQVKQDLERLATLVEKYPVGEAVAQRLFVAFERLRRERWRVNKGPVKALQARLDNLTTRMLTLDDRLYEFDHQAAVCLNNATAVALDRSSAQRQDDLTAIRHASNDQKAAWMTSSRC